MTQEILPDTYYLTNIEAGNVPRLMIKRSLAKQSIRIEQILDRHAYSFPSRSDGSYVGVLNLPAYSVRDERGWLGLACQVVCSALNLGKY